MRYLKIKSFLFVLLILIIGCNKSKVESPCDVTNPQENLEWLNHILQKSFCADVYKIEYNGNKYIGIYDCPAGPGAADLGWIIYNCDGTIFCKLIGFTGQCDCPDDFTDNAKKTLIYHQDEPINH
ncbi:MAG: hypothetical protein L3J74_04455 [Bacteroidales bacterium]|nr:hypothetical protein [Bacteroidales bacterium]